MKIKLTINPLDICLLAIVLLTLLAACSCNTLKKQQAKAESFYYKNPGLLAKKSEQMFPNIIEGTTKGRVDTVRDVVTIQGEKGEPGAPGSVRIIQTHSTDTLRIESGVKVAQMQAQVDKLQSLVEALTKSVEALRGQNNALIIQSAKTEKSLVAWKFRALILLVMVVAYVGFRVFRLFRP